MAADLERLLERAAMDAFEQMGFLFPDEEPESEAERGDMVGVRVRFAGPSSGAVVLRGDDTVLRALATNMLGMMEPPSRELQLDALGEMANVICGNIVPLVEDPAAVFRLGAPEAVAGELITNGERGRVRLGFEGGVVEVELHRADA